MAAKHHRQSPRRHRFPDLHVCTFATYTFSQILSGSRSARLNAVLLQWAPRSLESIRVSTSSSTCAMPRTSLHDTSSAPSTGRKRVLRDESLWVASGSANVTGVPRSTYADRSGGRKLSAQLTWTRATAAQAVKCATDCRNKLGRWKVLSKTVRPPPAGSCTHERTCTVVVVAGKLCRTLPF